MSRPVTIQWPAASTTAVCLSQAKVGAGALVINGTLASADDSKTRYATFPDIERTVSITSVGDLHLINFTITGTLRGNVVSETRVGPNANTVYTAQKFTTVTSVTVSGTLIANASVGTGLTGSTIWYQSDYFRTYNALGVFVAVTANVINYTFQTTYDDISAIATPIVVAPIDGVTIPTIPAATTMVGATVSVLANYTIPTNFSRVLINAGSDITGAATIYFCQQGVR